MEDAILAASSRHKESREKAVAGGVWVFDETAEEVGLRGGAIIAPSGHAVAYIFTYEDGWRECWR